MTLSEITHYRSYSFELSRFEKDHMKLEKSKNTDLGSSEASEEYSRSRCVFWVGTSIDANSRRKVHGPFAMMMKTIIFAVGML